MNKEVRLAPMLKKGIERALKKNIDPGDENIISHFGLVSERCLKDLKIVVEDGDEILARNYLRYLASPNNYKYIDSFLEDVVINNLFVEKWIELEGYCIEK